MCITKGMPFTIRFYDTGESITLTATEPQWHLVSVNDTHVIFIHNEASKKREEIRALNQKIKKVCEK